MKYIKVMKYISDFMSIANKTWIEHKKYHNGYEMIDIMGSKASYNFRQ
jgi:hypothetical protein